MIENFYPDFEIIFAAWTLFIYDYVLGLQDEITYIWSRPWGWGKLAYILNRMISVGFIVSSHPLSFDVLQLIGRI